MAAALLDRLLHRCHIVNIRGNSYRMRRHADLSKAIHPGAARDSLPASSLNLVTTERPRAALPRRGTFSMSLDTSGRSIHASILIHGI
ncbi:ATP-binding protein [Candidatus Palauibacter sp.]|uniref:ATP-binding protein n=1 Tax=Candidatus Palauibacter sp. TaxID=3101350 RepID=UPI003B52891C